MALTDQEVAELEALIEKARGYLGEGVAMCLVASALSGLGAALTLANAMRGSYWYSVLDCAMAVIYGQSVFRLLQVNQHIRVVIRRCRWLVEHRADVTRGEAPPTSTSSE